VVRECTVARWWGKSKIPGSVPPFIRVHREDVWGSGISEAQGTVGRQSRVKKRKQQNFVFYFRRPIGSKRLFRGNSRGRNMRFCPLHQRSPGHGSCGAGSSLPMGWRKDKRSARPANVRCLHTVNLLYVHCTICRQNWERPTMRRAHRGLHDERHDTVKGTSYTADYFSGSKSTSLKEVACSFLYSEELSGSPQSKHKLSPNPSSC
jgi:hypothetical protein